MVWFQCEDCGDNLKKPKLPTHFRVCSAFKLSCIDCGKVFGQHDVETHTQCITEAEKYGPKGQGKVLNGTNTTPKSNTKQKPEVDINVGLSERPPWFCSLCKTSATSKQTLLAHADGKKHRGKARAFHAAKQQPSDDTKEMTDLTENNATNKAPDSKVLGNAKDQNTVEVAPLPTVENDASKSNKKRELTSDKDGVQTGGDVSADLSNGEVVQIKGAETEATKGLKKARHSGAKEDTRSDSNLSKDSEKKEIKWKKLITSALKSNPDSVMKFKKLRKLVATSLEESGFKEDKKQITEMLEQKISSSSRFVMDGKSVRIAAEQSS